MNAKHILIGLLGAAVLLAAPLAFPGESHLLVDVPQNAIAVADAG
jgi:hypothetical protein